MFPPNELISLVFANDHDICYGADLLALNLDQYLWKNLHPDYQSVFFLKADGNAFSIYTYGDISAAPFKPEPPPKAGLTKLFPFIKSPTRQAPPEKPFGSWLLEQLCRPRSEAAAFVCSMEDFCYVLSHADWTPLLTQIAELQNRTGIFVLTASSIAEKSRDLLLSCSVFDQLNDPAVTMLHSSIPQDLYQLLLTSKGRHCLFLNAFTRDRIRNLLLHLCFRIPDRFDSLSSLNVLTDYLFLYLHDPKLELTAPLKHTGLPASCMTHRELYEFLSDPAVWRTLTDRAAQHHTVLHGRTSAPISIPSAPVHRARDSFAGRFLAHRLPQWMASAPPDIGFTALDYLCRIRTQLSAPQNRTENQMLTDGADILVDRLDRVDETDFETYRIILEAIDFCVNQLYLPYDALEYDRVQEILGHWSNVIDMSARYFRSQQSLDRNYSSLGNDPTGSLQLSRMELQKKVDKFRRDRDVYLVLTRDNILSLGVLTPISDTEVFRKRISELQIASLEVYDDDFLEFTEEDYRIKPPQ